MAEENTGGQAQVRLKKKGKKRSVVWAQFEDFIDVNGEQKAKCKICNAEFAADSKAHGTGTLLRHIKSCPEQQDGGRRGRHQGSPQPRAAPREPSNCRKPDGEEVINDLARMIALHGYDSSIVEDSYFRSFVSRLNPDFQVPSRVAIGGICDGIFDEAERDFQSQLVRASAQVSLALNKAETVEGPVLYIEYHFIDDEWNRRKMITDACVVPALAFYHGPLFCFREVAVIEDFIFVGASCIPEIGLFSTSSVHIEPKNLLKDILCHYGQRAPPVSTICVNIVLDSIANFILDNLFQSDDLRAYGERWYSCYCSLQVLQKYPSSKTSELIELLSKLWGEIYRAIKAISDPKRPTSNICLRELFKVRELLQSELEGASGDKAGVDEDSDGFDGDEDSDGCDGDVADVLGEAKDILDRSIKDSYIVWSIPLVLDPRYKLKYIGFSFRRAFDSHEAEIYISKVTAAIKEMFTAYSKDDGETADGDPNRVNEMAVDSADPLEQAWNEHCRLQDGVTEVADTELDRYLEDHPVPPTDGFDILNWWKVNSSKYPAVARMARAALGMPTSSRVSSEQMSQIRSIVRRYSEYC